MGKKAEKEPKRLEELLLDDSESLSGGEMGTDQEVRIVGGKRGSHFSSLILLFIFCLLVLGVGYFYLQRMMLPLSTQVQHQYYVSPKLPVPERYETTSADRNVVSAHDVADKKVVEEKVADTAVTPAAAQPPSLLTVTVGPLIGDDEVEQAVEQLELLGFQPEINKGRGMVTMIRLLEGTYPAEIARTHLAQLKKSVKSAFLLPQGDQISVFAGSFHQQDRAEILKNDLAKKNIRVTLVDGAVEMDGILLTVIQADQQTAREVADHLTGLGLQTSIREKK